MSTPISNHFSYEEFERSSKARELAIDNRIPSDKIRFALRILVLNLLQPLRDCLKRPLVVASGYRCPALNRTVGGSMSSQHMKGEAADLFCKDALEALFLAQVVLRHCLPFDQMILYRSHLHLSFKAHGPQRHQVLYDPSYKKAIL